MNYFILIISFTMTLILSPLLIKFAIKKRIFDKPNKIKIHKSSIPYLGGIAIYLSFITSILFIIFINHFEFIYKKQLMVILIGATILMIFGLLDDLKKVKAIYKLLFEFLMVILLFFFGLGIDIFNNIYLNFIFTVLWVVFIVNAFNNIDGMDGLAAGIAIICGFFFLLIYGLGNNFIAIFLSLVIIGSCSAFLFFNFHPAKIFMGDAGSLFLGFCIAVIPISSVVDVHNLFVSILIPILILGFIILDSSFILIKRFFKKQSLITGDLEHTYNFLANKIKNNKNTVLLFYLINILLGAIAFTLFLIF